MRTVIITMVFCVVIAPFLYGQGISHYINLTDPEAISRLDLTNRTPLRYKTGFGYPQETDSLDGYHIIAGDTGRGVITHFWMTVPIEAPETAFVKLYIDDTLVRVAKVYDFFRESHGLLRMPLTTPMAGANICDIQMPYTKNFRITIEGVNSFVFYAVAFRRDEASNKVSFDPLTTDIKIQAEQTEAEQSYLENSNPWVGFPSSLEKKEFLLGANDTTVLFQMSGPSLIHSLRLLPESYDQLLLDSLWLDITWDDEPFSSVNVPLGDFFMVPPDTMKIRAFQLRVDKDSGMVSYFPMPFRRSAKIRIINRSRQSITMQAECAYEKKEIDISKYAYFYSTFSETNPTRYHVSHPVLTTNGDGRLVGTSLRIKNNTHIRAFEGDTFMEIDGNPLYKIQYTGTEDYIGGGYYFHFKTYSMPLSGHTQFSQRLYRFHYLDAIDFHRSFDFHWQHGNDNDVREDYRTVAYYYKRYIPFWTSRDTVRSGEEWIISGTGYKPDEKITARLDDENIVEVNANGAGKFLVSTTIPSSWQTGYRKLSINDIAYPTEILVLQKPILYSCSDFQPPVLLFGDTLLIKGRGFVQGEKLTVYLDSIRISYEDTILVKNDYSFEAVVRIPYIADRSYRLAVHGETSGRVVSNTPIILTRRLEYEFEDHVSSAIFSGRALTSEMLTARWHSKWSKQATALLSPYGSGDSVQFILSVPKSDTFDLKLLLSRGKQFGSFDYLLDHTNLGVFTGFVVPEPDWRDMIPSDTLTLGTHYLSAGEHTFTFRCTGKADSAQGYFLGADVLLLKPTTILPLSPGTITDTTTSVSELPKVSLYPYIYPNPVSTKGVVIGMTKDNLSSDSGAVCTIRIIDASGRTMFRSMLPFENFRAEEHIKTETFAAGSYFVIFTYTQGKETREFSRLLTVTK